MGKIVIGWKILTFYCYNKQSQVNRLTTDSPNKYNWEMYGGQWTDHEVDIGVCGLKST